MSHELAIMEYGIGMAWKNGHPIESVQTGMFKTTLDVVISFVSDTRHS